jgi:hypothetical protein
MFYKVKRSQESILSFIRIFIGFRQMRTLEVLQAQAKLKIRTKHPLRGLVIFKAKDIFQVILFKSCKPQLMGNNLMILVYNP